MNSLVELKTILSKTIEDKSVAFEESFLDSYESLELHELKEVYMKNTTSLLNYLEIMHTEKIIDNEQFYSRVSSLLNIVKLVDEITSYEEQQ